MSSNKYTTVISQCRGIICSLKRTLASVCGFLSIQINEIDEELLERKVAAPV
jgi:hypothetical protein